MLDLSQHAPCFYFAATDSGTLIEVNDLLSTHLEYEREELLHQPVEKIFPIATRVFQQTHLIPLIKLKGSANEIYISLQSKSKKQIPVLLNVVRRNCDDQMITHYAGIMVLHRKKFEEELIASRNAAESALFENTALLQTKKELQENFERLDQQLNITHKQNEELVQFNRVVTHDLEEPLRKLSLFIQLLREAEGKESRNAVLEKLVRVSGQLSGIVSGLQQYVWVNETRVSKRVIDIHAILPGVQAQLQNEYPDAGLEDVANSLPHIHADSKQMSLLFYHLLSNAIRFRQPGMSAVVEISSTDIQQNQFRRIEGKYKFSNFTRILVRDNGIGFDPQYKDQVFELFKKLHPVSGQGVGLSLCQRIMENHEGSISITSERGKGTTITLLLPNASGIEDEKAARID
ncbi:MAG: PAS domain-containing protein [Chitinophagaceae bacterium]|nr:PAS domain-containing protein [Chitinophagaceae bacterium]